MKARRLLLPSISTLVATFACASSNLDIPEDHPANYRAATAPLPLAKPLVAAAPSEAPSSTPSMPADHHHHGSQPIAPTKADAPAPTTSAAPATSAKPQAGETWTCPMHPQIVRTEPGKCPICGMNLVKSTKSHEGAH
jgi:hypothetical protein